MGWDGMGWTAPKSKPACMLLNARPRMTTPPRTRRFKCNVCAMLNEIPVEYFCNLDADGRRRDVLDRPELSAGTVEYVAPAEYMVGAGAGAGAALMDAGGYVQTWHGQRGVSGTCRLHGFRAVEYVGPVQRHAQCLSCPLTPHHMRDLLFPCAQVRPPMPPVYFFVIDVSAGAVSSGMLATVCETIKVG